MSASLNEIDQIVLEGVVVVVVKDEVVVAVAVAGRGAVRDEEAVEVVASRGGPVSLVGSRGGPLVAPPPLLVVVVVVPSTSPQIVNSPPSANNGRGTPRGSIPRYRALWQ